MYFVGTFFLSIDKIEGLKLGCDSIESLIIVAVLMVVIKKLFKFFAHANRKGRSH